MIAIADVVQSPTFPWEALGNVGAAMLVCTVWAYCFKAMATQRSETAAELRIQRKEFTDTLTNVTGQFGDRVEAISDRVAQSNERVELAMRDLALELRTGAPRVKT